MTGTVNFLQSLGWAVLNSLWQLALLWILYQIIIGLFRKMKSGARSSLATALLITGFAWFLYSFLSVFGQGSASEAISGSPLVNAAVNPELNLWLQKTLPIASVTYLLLLVFPLLHFTRNYRYVQVIRKFGLTKIEPQWRIFVRNIAAHMGIRREVKIWISEYVASPVTIGFLKPVILVPVAAINHLTPQQLEAVLLHELSHIRRYDYLLNLVLQFIQTILYFNPFAKAFIKIVEREREKSCDEMVLQFQYDSHEYASALLQLEKAGQTTRIFTMAANGKKADLLSRVERILGVHKKEVFSFNRLAGVMAGLLCVIALNAILIISRPASAHTAGDFTGLRNLGEFFRQPLQQPVEEETTTAAAATVTTTERPATIVNHIDPVRSDDEVASVKPVELSLSPAGFVGQAFSDQPFMPASVLETIAPALTETQKLEVKQAIENSRKVIANSQWKAVEKNIADVFTSREKEQLKQLYEKQLEKIDWNNWENKLAYAYNSVEWEKVNAQLDQAVKEIRLDSIQAVYAEAISKISEVQSELAEQNLKGVPDSQYDFELLEQKKGQLSRELNRLKAVRVKKVVHL